MLRCIAPFLVCFCLAVTGCATTGADYVDSEQQQAEALSRWKGCLDRQSFKLQKAANSDQSEALMRACAGHRRDVLLTFPASMERQLDLLLRQRTHERALKNTLIKTGT